MQISKYIESRDWEGLSLQLSRMSNSEFRRTETTIRTYMQSLDNALFWEAWQHLLEYRHQAFLACVLSVRHLAKNNKIDFKSEEAQRCAAWIIKYHSDEVVKILRMAIPLLCTETQISEMFNLFGIDDEESWISILIREETPLSYYMLFRALQKADDPALSRAVFLNIIKRNTDISFNMSSIIKTYFGLDDVKSHFAQLVQPYELSHITRSYDNFYYYLMGKQPTI